MDNEHYYHMFANGDDAKNFITTENEFKVAFNRIGLCAYLSGVIIVSFSIEDSHPHVLLWGTLEKCARFKKLYEDMSIRSIASRRGSSDGVVLHCELYEVLSESYLMNVAAYTITQPTKDGKPVMPYDYRYGSGALYFRSVYTILPWLVGENGKYVEPVEFGTLSKLEKQRYCGSKKFVPDWWLVCNGFILPTNYVDVQRFESVYKTHNCFRAFMCSAKSRDESINVKMAEIRGVVVEDLEARRISESVCKEMFGKRTVRHLNIGERMQLANTLRNRYRLAHRQLSFLTRIPEVELRKYIR